MVAQVLKKRSKYGTTVATCVCCSMISLTQMARSEEHTSELQSQSNLVCRLLLEKKKKQKPRRSRAGWRQTSLGRSGCTPAVGFGAGTRRGPPCGVRGSFGDAPHFMLRGRT